MKKLLAAILALVMAMSLCTSAWATEGDVAKVNGVGYATLDEAIAAVNDDNDGPIELIGDITLNKDTVLPCGLLVPNGGSVTLDLGGKTLSGADDTYAVRATNKSTLTVKNGTIVCGGVDEKNDGWAWVIDNRGGNVLVENVVIKANSNKSVVDAVTANWDWDFVSGDDETGYALNENGQYATTTLRECIVEDELWLQAYNHAENKLIIESGTYKSPKFYGTIIVNGGTLGTLCFDENITYANSVVFKPTWVNGNTCVPETITNKIVFDDATLNLSNPIQFMGGNYEGTVHNISIYNTPVNESLIFGENVTLSDGLVASINAVLDEKTGSSAGYHLLKRDNKWAVVRGDVVSITAKADESTPVAWISIDGDRTGTPTNGTSKTLLKNESVTLQHSGVSDKNYEFKGWYVGDELKSTDNPYTFSAGETATYVAKFGLRKSISDAISGAENWYTTNAGGETVEIKSISDMNYFAAAVAAGKDFTGKTVKLMTDLDYEGKEFFVVGGAKHAFTGTFDGNNKVISNIASDKVVRLEDDGGDTFAGLFAKLNNATVQNLKLTDCSFEQSFGMHTYSGGIAAEAGGNTIIKNCSIKNVTTSGWFNGAVIGHTFGGVTVESVTVTGCTASGTKGGAVVGYSDSITIKDVTVKEVKGGAALIGHANAGDNLIENVTVDAPDAPLINTTYSDSKGRVTIKGEKTEINAKNIVGKTVSEGKTVTVENGSYTLGNVVEDGNESQKSNLTISGGTFKNSSGDRLDVTQYVESGKHQDGSGTVGSKSTSSGGYYYYGPSISAVLNGPNKSATDYTSGDYGLIFRSTASYSSFTGVQVDGKTLAKGNYTVEANGSGTEVYLKAAYLKTLAAGKHTVTILSTAGNVSMDFTIGGKTSSPTTFDAGVGIYAVTAVLSLGGMAWTAKKRQD